MERPEPAAASEEQLADASDAGDAVPQATTVERRAGWIDRRKHSEEG
jgi:hypothetical protein